MGSHPRTALLSSTSSAEVRLAPRPCRSCQLAPACAGRPADACPLPAFAVSQMAVGKNKRLSKGKKGKGKKV